MEYFYIKLEHPNAVYFPGHTIRGSVIFNSSAHETTKGIMLQFEGKASVHWTGTNSVRTGCTNGSHTRTRSISFDSSDVFFETHMLLYGDGQTEKIIPAGEVSFPFEVQLPTYNVFTSFNGDFGRVEYTIYATVKRSFWKLDYKTRKTINVQAIKDLNQEPMTAIPGAWKISKTFCCLCCASGLLTLYVKLPRTGYCPGDCILIEVDINNGSSREIYDVSVEILQQFTYFAEGECKKQSVSIASARRGQHVHGYDSDYWRLEMQVPSIPPTNLGGCRIIKLDYMIKVEAHVSGAALNLFQMCPITIGTIPIKHDVGKEIGGIYSAVSPLYLLFSGVP